MIPVAKSDWDLTPAIDLIYSLSITSEDAVESKEPSSPISDSKAQSHRGLSDSESVSQLGNFDKLWQFLGQALDTPPPTLSSVPENGFIDVCQENGVSSQLPLKAVKWRDELEGAELADDDENHGVQQISALTKTQKKRAKRKQRQRDRSDALTNGTAVSSSSEEDVETNAPIFQTPDRTAIIHNILHGTSPSTSPSFIRSGQLRSGKSFRPESTNDQESWPVASPQSAKQVVKALEPPKVDLLAIAAQKKTKLISMLNGEFIDERQYLCNISLTPCVSNGINHMPEGVHVFVDASNIMIGFHDALKISRGQSIAQRIRRQPLSFHNLSLVLERGRPTAKRILVGSDNFPAIVEAKALGYETNILDRVHKAKELTPRQRKFSDRNHGTGTGTGSGSETAAATATVQYAPEKWVEQAVDEILHLKMMESIVDASEPSIMVLATGDAAEAEYSGGFLKMVDRALAKGWKVELASFRHNTSSAYKRRDFRQKWGDKFKIVELDAFVELLLGMD